MPDKSADSDADYSLDAADDKSSVQELPQPTDPASIPPDEGDAGADQ